MQRLTASQFFAIDRNLVNFKLTTTLSCIQVTLVTSKSVSTFSGTAFRNVSL
jgi:hypothetical protein